MSVPAFLVAVAVSATPLPPPEAPPIMVDIPSPPAPDAAETDSPAGQAPADSAANAIVVTGHAGPRPSDPAEALNEGSFAVTEAVDDAVIAPVAKGYKHVLPKPVRDGLHNFIINLHEPVVALNFLLQLKPGKAAETLGRFAIDSTIGFAGVVDVAKRRPFNLPHRPNGFADTLGYYGVGPGPYLFLPLIGPTTVRDLAGRVADLSVLPLAGSTPLSQPPIAIARGTVASLDRRVRNDDHLRKVRQSDDPYVTMRDDYLARRRAEIASLHAKRAPAIETADR